MKWIAIFLAMTGPAIADTSACLANMIEIQNPGFTTEQITTRKVRLTVTNKTDHVLTNVWIEFELWVPERPTAIEKGQFRGLINIPGGMLPGETIKTSDAHFMGEREVGIATHASAIELRPILRNVMTLDGTKAVESPPFPDESGLLLPCN